MSDLERLLDEAGRTHRDTRYPGDLGGEVRGRGIDAGIGTPGKPSPWLRLVGSSWPTRVLRVAAALGVAALLGVWWNSPSATPEERLVVDSPTEAPPPTAVVRASPKPTSPPSLIRVGWPTAKSAGQRPSVRLSLSEAGARSRKPAARWRPKASLFSHPPRRRTTPPPAAVEPADPSGTSRRHGLFKEFTT